MNWVVAQGSGGSKLTRRYQIAPDVEGSERRTRGHPHAKDRDGAQGQGARFFLFGGRAQEVAAGSVVAAPN